MDNVALDEDACTAVHIDAASAALVTIGRVAIRVDVIHEITHYGSIAGTIHGGIRVLAFEANEINANVVVIMHNVVRDREEFHVAIQYHRFTPAELAVINFVAVNEEIVNGGIRVASIDCDAMRAATSTAIFNFMHFVVADFDECAVAAHRNPLRESG